MALARRRASGYHARRRQPGHHTTEATMTPRSTPPGITLEMCVDSVDAALAAEAGGADRVELCANLLEGGTTPSPGTIALACERLGIPVHVIVRPRGGDFLYTDAEFEVMRRDVLAAKAAGARGVVIGLLTAEGDVDVERTAELIALARPMSVTFHRAFDMARDPYGAIEALVGLGVERLLTSGQEDTALEGLDLIADLCRLAGERLVVMPGGGITPRNVGRILAASGAREVHVHAAEMVEGPMRHRNTRCYMGGELRPPEFARAVTTPDAVRAVREALG
jgi:copper homeostasis protein